MWIATICKSFSERNVTVPFVTFYLGPVLGNLFKVTQDAALLLQRLIFRTIGTTDTSLFAYLKNTHTITHDKLIFQHAFSQLATKLAYLTIPLIGLVWFMQCQVTCCGSNNYGFQLFFIISIGLLLELLLTPYERILEVYANYRDLGYAYLFYLIGLAIIFGALSHGYIQLVAFVIALYTTRLLSMIIMAYAVYNRYHITYPIKKILILLISIMVLSYILHHVASYFCGTALLTMFTHLFAI